MRNVFSIRSSALSPTARYRVLAALTALGAVQCAAFAVWPPDPGTPSTALLVAAAVLAVAALGVWLVLPGEALADRRVGGDPRHGICAAGYFGATASDQLAAALGLALLAGYCAYFLPLGRMLFQVVWMIGLFVALTIASPQLDSLLYTAIVVVTLVALVWMVSHLASLLAAAAVRDPLTGILNRRGLAEAAELVHAVILRAERRISVVAIDLNNFKGYNDKNGHLAGDRLLVDLARAGRGCFGPLTSWPAREGTSSSSSSRIPTSPPPTPCWPASTRRAHRDGPQGSSNGRPASPSPTPSARRTRPSTSPRRASSEVV